MTPSALPADESAERTGSAAQPAPPAGVRRRQPPRATVRTVECPTCGAPAGEQCRGRRGPRVSNHFARVELATELRYGQRLQLPRTVAEVRPVTADVKRAVLLDVEQVQDATLARSGSAHAR